MITLRQKLAWRTQLLTCKLTGRCGNVPWPLMYRWIVQSHEGGEADVKVLEQDPNAGMTLLQVGAHRIWFPAGASTELLGRFYCEVFQPRHPHYYEYAGARLERGSVAVDAGACEGYFIRFALDRGARVLAVEPWSMMVACLERTFADEIRQGRLHVVRALLGSSAGEDSFCGNLDHPFASGAGERPAGERTVRETVPVRTLDSIVMDSPFGAFDFLKMDIEGAEREALCGAEQVIRQFRPRVSITTYHKPDDWRYLERYLHGLVPGYRFTHKGVAYYPGGWRPMLLHGWVPG